jgi:hypothetical protein
MPIKFMSYLNTDEISIEELQALAKEEEIVARAEFSGSEGCFVEVCRWNPATQCFERYCFEKFLGGELGNDANALDTAIAVAAQIAPLTPDHRLFRSMSRWSGLQIKSESSPAPIQPSRKLSFIQSSRAGYFEAARSKMRGQGIVDDVILFVEDEESRIEAIMTWYVLPNQNWPSPVLELFDEAWRMFNVLPDLFQNLAEISKAQSERSIQPAEFCKLLKQLGFVDETIQGPTVKEYDALKAAAHHYGVQWKGFLKDCWRTGKFPQALAGQVDELRALHRRLGESWLNPFELRL